MEEKNNNIGTDGKILNFEQFRGQRELDKDYPKFLGNAERIFEGKFTPEAMMKRLYYTLRYLEGHINGLSMLWLLAGLDMEEQKRGVKLIIDWLEDIIENLKGFYSGNNKQK